MKPITLLEFTAGPDFLNRVQRQLGGRAADWSKNGVGYLVYRLPHDRDTPIRKTLPTPGSGESWKLYREQGTGAEKWFISYQEAHFATNHGIPMWWDNSPDIYVGVLKQNVFIEIAYTAYFPSWDWSYTRTINQDIGFAARVLSKAAQ